MIKLRLPDGTVKEHEKGLSVYEATSAISEGLARASVGAVVNGEIKGMMDTIDEDADFQVVKFEDPEGKQIFWHTSAHVMALAVKRLFPDTKFAIGPAIENGFYYDFDTEHKFSQDDFEKIEAEMKKIVKEANNLEKIEISREDALKKFKDAGEIYKVDLIEGIEEGEKLSIYKLDEFEDLCRGPHLTNPKKIKAVKLLSVAGAYWRGDENNKMLQRIYAISFEKKKQLDEYLERLEEAKKRDHRKLGKELDLFSIHEEGPGFPFFHPKGMIVRNELENFWREIHLAKGYGEIRTPIILNQALWLQSGHWDHYKDNMYLTEIDEENYAIKPMNCPGSILVYKSGLRSYRDLPLKWGELGLVHRHELSGTLHGLFRVRSFTQDDAHIFCLPEQVKEQLVEVMELADHIYKTFGFKYSVELSTRPEDSMGSEEQWNMAEDGLKAALEEKGIDYRIDEGDGAFYGPKIDFQLEDAIGRTWQCGTIQLDFQMPERFEMEYIDNNGEKKRPVMIHRALFGSMERFMGILIEHYAGRFPSWLAPVQVKVLPISDKFNDYAGQVNAQLIEAGIRSEIDLRDEKIGYKIREGQTQRIPYLLVVGQKEVDENKVTVRAGSEGIQSLQAVAEFADSLLAEIKDRR